MTNLLGLDIGTTSAKAVLFQLDGTVVAENEQPYPILNPKNGWAEQVPTQIEEATIHAVNQVMTHINQHQLIGIGLSTAMHSLICINEDGTALSNAIIWADTRSSNESEQLDSSIYLSTGTPLHPMSPLSKLTWMKNQDAQEYHEASYFVSIKEYLLYRWFGEKVVDYSMAAATGLFNIHRLNWDDQALRAAGITTSQLFEPKPPETILQDIDSNIAKRMNISVKTPIVIGGSDGPLANLGIGAINPGETAITIGTSGAIRQFSREPLLDTKQEIFSYSFTEDLWITGGPTNNGGIVLKWIQEVVSNEHYEYSMDELNQLASSVSPGAEQLVFLPYLNGERAPFWDGKAKGSFIGLTPSHNKSHLIRASMEGVIYSIYHIGHALERLGNQHDVIYASGGFARSELWLQILADTFGKPVKIPNSHQSSAWGAAWLALCGIEKYQLEDIKDSIPMSHEIEPQNSHHKQYQKIFSVYQKLYYQLKDTFHELS
ncbi:gluconokinase [Aquisalibacillus elongatus]|uniref:Gluconate kinase (FGGY family) n=1 Tax=Aquisalibacillus elongatus TaxID=485577 RepID=A0A3N5CBR3_9BACI|nr:gluconokinase [Aquisalibacillus elongatus]RPF54311.1 gluconate kinase (FGGY family) [Aquisalibacillus elongatus]